MLRSRFAALLALLALSAACPPPPDTPQLPNATASGYLDIEGGDHDDGSLIDPGFDTAARSGPHAPPRLFFLFYESAGSAGEDTPITLWLQGGPGCASLFGAFYELGPELVDDRLGLVPNPGAWNRRSALLFIDQPVGAGFSTPGRRRRIPRDELALAADLYSGLQAFFRRFPHLQARPLVIAGESYAGKYVPSIGHFILQQSPPPNGTLLGGSRKGSAAGSQALSQRRPIEQALLAARPLLAQPPLFRLAGLAIGNGLTNPATQVMSHADVAYYGGFIDPRQRLRAMAMQLETVQLIQAGMWEEAHALRSSLLEHIRAAAGVATLLDMRRFEDYDAAHLVDCYLNLPEVKEALGVDPSVAFESCSAAVGDALGPDVMRSVARLVPDLLAARLPLLLYQGMHDAQDGPASSNAWIYSLDWERKSKFLGARRHVVRARQVEDVGGTPLASDADAGDSGGGDTAPLVLPGGTGRSEQHPLAGSGAAGATGPASAASSAAALRKRRGGPGEAAVAYWKAGGGLTHVVLTRAGHMAPRDDPATTRWPPSQPFSLHQAPILRTSRPIFHDQRRQQKAFRGLYAPSLQPVDMRPCTSLALLLGLLALACSCQGNALSESASRTHIRRLLQGGGSTATSTAEAIAAALAAGDTQAAAAAIAKAAAAGDTKSIAQATAIATAAGQGQALAQAAAQAASQGGTSTASAVAQAVSSGSGAQVTPQQLQGGQAQAVGSAIQQGAGSCSSKASSSAGGFSQESSAVASAVSSATASVCGGGDANAQAQAAAKATATATATAFANAAAEVQSSPGCSGCASASGTATAVAKAFASASAAAFAAAADKCCPGQSQALSSALATAVSEQIATATASAAADACASGGGSASASSSAISTAVATATAEAYATAFAALSKCAASAGAAGGATAGGGPAPGPAPAPAPVPVLTAAGAPPAGPKASTQGVPGPAPAPAGGLRPCPSFVQQQCCAKKVDRCLCAGASSVCQYGKAGDNPLVYGLLFRGRVQQQGRCRC